MIKEQETHRFAQYVDNNLNTLLPGAISMWQQHHDLVIKAFHEDLNPQEMSYMSALANFRLQAEAALVPYLMDNQMFLNRWHPIYDIDALIQKKNWMPKLMKLSQTEHGDFYCQPFSNQIQTALLYTISQIDTATLNQILTTPCLSEQKFEPGKTVRYVRRFNLPTK